MVTVPVVPSRMRSFPSASRSVPEQLTTAGIPSDFAKIAVWLVGPPSAVNNPTTSLVPNVAVSAGARSRATRMYG